MELTEILIPVASLSGLGLVLASVLLYASKKFYVYEDPLIDEINELLPQANCGGCGDAGCRSFAARLVETMNDELFCPVTGVDGMKQVFVCLGMEGGNAARKVARVRCQGTYENAAFLAAYHGIGDCLAAALIDGGERGCAYACYGLGTCIEACQFGAMEISQGVVVVNEDLCTSCGACVKVCPQGIIELLPVDKRVFVKCSNHDKGAPAKRSCKVACIACNRCAKECRFDAIKVEDNLARVDPELCTLCGACVLVCPSKCITVEGGELPSDTVLENEPPEVAQ